MSLNMKKLPVRYLQYGTRLRSQQEADFMCNSPKYLTLQKCQFSVACILFTDREKPHYLLTNNEKTTSNWRAHSVAESDSKFRTRIQIY